MKAAIVALLLLLASSLAAWAVNPGERLTDPRLEARAEAIGSELRCLVCQNETIEESSADLAHDLRVLLRRRLAKGDTDAQAIQFIVARYGDFVLLKPPVEPATYVLWFGPAAVLLLAGLGTAIYLRRRRPGAMAGPAPLSAAERQRLDELLDDGDPSRGEG